MPGPDEPVTAPIPALAVGYGAPALAALRVAVSRAKQNDALAPVTVIVPNNFVGVATRRSLASGDHGAIVGDRPGVAGVTFLTLYRLAELLGAPTLAAAGRRPVATPVVAAAVRQALASEPGIFAAVAEHPTTERRLVQAHRELSDVDNRHLGALAAASTRASEVVRIHRQVRAALAPLWHSEQDLVDAAIEALPSATGVVGDLGDVIIFLPDVLSPRRADFVRAVSQHQRVHIIAGFTGAPDADAEIERTLDRLGASLGTRGAAQHPQAQPEAQPGAAINGGTGGTAVVTATNVSDPDDEVRHVVRELIAAADNGARFDAMAVVYASDQPYARLLHDHLNRAGVPFNGAAVAGLAESVPGRTLLRLLRLGDRNLRRDDVIGLIASLPFRWQGQAAPTRAWDQISREAGVVRGIDEWTLRLQRFSADKAATAERYRGDPDREARVERLQRDSERALELLAFVTDLDTLLKQGLAADRWSRHVQWCRRALRKYTGDLRGWPDDQVAAAERLDAALGRLSGLDLVEQSPSAAVFRRTLEMELDGGLGRVGRMGQGVLIGRAWSTVGLELDHLWVLGMAEGVFPSRPQDDSLLPDRERVRAGGQLPLRRDRVGDEHRQLLATVAGVRPGGTARLFRSRGDLRASNERAPSRWLAELAPPGEAEWDHEIASFHHGVLTSTFPATAQEQAIRTLVEAQRSNNIAGHPLLSDAAFAASVEMQAARASNQFTRFDGNVGNVAQPAMPLRTSATAIETWVACPHQYFAKHILGVYPLDTPEQRMRIDALSKGLLVHEILEAFVNEAITAAGGVVGKARPNPDKAIAFRLWDRDDVDRLMAVADAKFAVIQQQGLTGEPLYWRRDQVLIRRDLLRFIDEDNARRLRCGSLVPLGTEVGFGTELAPPTNITLASGAAISLRGSIDRIDLASDGSLAIVDYKTGTSFKVSEDDPVKDGKRLQLGLYAQAVRELMRLPDAEVTSIYWFVSRKGNFDESGYRATDAVIAEVNAVVDLAVAHITAGHFPQRPDDSTRTNYIACHYCDPDGLGVREARRRFEVVANHPALEDYMALVEPNLVPQRPLAEEFAQ